MKKARSGWLIPAFIASCLTNCGLVLLWLAGQPEFERAFEAFTPVAVPIAVALIAWYGVSSNIKSSRESELLNQWHSNVRWATDLTLDEDDHHVTTGIAVLDSLDDLAFLGDEENELIDAIVESTAQRYADIYDN